MAKFDEKLERMNYLMEFRSPSFNKAQSSPVEYHTTGADGKVYGILKEGTKYYIKTTEQGKENLAESYDYVNGFNNKKDFEYNGYNEATKQLELKLMSLNEAYGVKKNVSTVNLNKSQESFTYLTEEARKELDHMHRIFENSGKIGKDNTTPVEYHGTASADNTKENNKPFDQTASATLDKDFKGTISDPAKANSEYQNVTKNIETDLQSDKMKGHGESGNQCFEKDVNGNDIDSEGTAIAAEKKNGAKAVKMNESVFELDDFLSSEEELPEDENMFDDEEALDGDETFGETEDAENYELGDDLVGTDDEPIMESDYQGGNFANAKKDIITGPEDTLDGPNTTDKKSNSYAYAEKHVGPDNGVMTENDEYTDLEGPTEDAMQGPDINGTKSPFGTRKGSLAYGEERVGLSESMINGLVNDVCKKLVKEGLLKKDTPKTKKKVVKESLEDKIQRMVNEEITRLNYWGKHPRYQKEPMQLPPNKEVMKGTADRDWNDDSAKGEQPYGQKIGSSAPFDDKVEKITNSVLQTLKESLKRNRK